ncbi:MAG: SixA phosphatase family protein [Salibacteraceae bacterium]
MTKRQETLIFIPKFSCVLILFTPNKNNVLCDTPTEIMKKLFIVRHAKSSWAEGKDDFDRGLKKRGKLNTPFMAGKLVSRGVKIDRILSSAAKRTVKTAKLMNEVFGLSDTQIEFSKKLYLSSPKTIINHVKETDDTVDELMLVAHNPGVTQVVNYLANEHFENIPTCGIACILFDIKSWSELKNNGTLGFFIYPKMFKQNNLK